jgi:hypothetical protein
MFDLSIDKLQIFIVLILPGFVALKVYDLFLPSKISLGSAIGEAAIYGLVNFAMFHWALLPINTGDYPKNHPTLYTLQSVLFLVVTPSLLAVVTYWVRTHRPITNWIDHPHRTGWEFFILKKRECWMLFHLKNGKMFGGHYGGQSYAATPPQEPEVYVENATTLMKTVSS